MKETTRLERLLGKEFIYKHQNIKIKDYYPIQEKGEINIITDGNPIRIKENEIVKFCEQLLPVDAPETKATQGLSVHLSAQVAEQTNGLLATLQQTLLDNIEAVKRDGGYIKQANTINSSVNALIGMAKLQIQVGKMNGGKK